MSDAKTLRFEMEMTCEGCSKAAERVLGKIKSGVSGFDVDLASKTVTVRTTLSPGEIQQILEKTGKKCTFVGAQ